MNSKNKGDLSESVVISEFLRLGIPVCLPFGDNQKYDLVIEVNGAFKSIQVKTGRFQKGVVTANICRSINTKNLSKSKQIVDNYKEDVDFIVIYCDQLKTTYLIKPKEFGNRTVSLRVESPKNKQLQNLHWAKDYILNRSLIG